MTKIWTQSPDQYDYTEARVLNDMGEHLDVYMAVMGCQSMTGRFPTTSLEILSDHPPSDYFDVGGMFIVSKRLKTVLDSFSVHAEFFAVQIVHDGFELTESEFYFCNILDCIEGFDLARGKYTYWKKQGFTDHIQKIRKLVIDESRVEPYDLFRLAKCSPNIICASDRLISKIVEQQLTGMKFIEPKDWRFGL